MPYEFSGSVGVTDYLTNYSWPSIVEPPDDNTVRRIRPTPLAGIELRAFGCKQPDSGEAPIWKKWAEGRTDDDGRYTLEASRAEGYRYRIRIEARFHGDDLRVWGEAGEKRDWMLLHEDSDYTREEDRDIPPTNFSPFSDDPTLGDTDNIVRGIFWFAGRRLVRLLAGRNQFLAFTGRVNVKWPAHPITGTSYAAKITKREAHVSHNVVDSEKIITLFHEMMHIWNYDHNDGMTKWWKAFTGPRWRIDGATDGDQEWPNIAFHEAFAEFAAEQFMTLLFGTTRQRPYRRPWLNRTFFKASRPQSGLAQAERNYFAVQSALNGLTHPDFMTFHFGVAGDGSSTSQSTVSAAEDVVSIPGRLRPQPPGYSIFNILRAFQKQPDAGYQTDWFAGNKYSGIRDFLVRLQKVAPLTGAPRLSDDMIGLIEQVIDPVGTTEPQDLWPAIVIAVPVNPPVPPKRPPPPRRRRSR